MYLKVLPVPYLQIRGVPNDAQQPPRRPERKPERKKKPGAEAAERPRRSANNKRTAIMARHPELRDPAPARPKIRL